ncbi:LrgB family protein [Fredinandcohnia sp. SECRCQ15]|uniref:LrgB family protein n=2 Tax=Fredinandcohnia quinoae TaxID=2918902 RepID=A0AAW5E7I5_9BACI|nr:LrgB family protein [Fredinandcohnia sp. SECRCQ15]MCH1625361.1 LrgB family protein [Fredinandcohnia sp. SECRCQ15]
MISFIIGTILVYQGMSLLYKRFHSPLLVPIATTTFILIMFLLLFSIPYDTYMIGGRWIDELLGPAVVALAYPLYQNRKALKKYFTPIFVGVISGTTTGILTGIYMAKLFSIDLKTMLSLTTKSVTSPVAIDIAEMIGGIPTLAVVYVMVAGISGAMFGPIFLKMAKINHYIGVGLGFGTASHGIGTAKALEIGKSEGAISSVSMIISAIYAAIICPIIIRFFI